MNLSSKKALTSLIKKQKELQKALIETGAFSSEEDLLDSLLSGLLRKISEAYSRLHPPFRLHADSVLLDRTIKFLDLDLLVDIIRYTTAILGVSGVDPEEIERMYFVKESFLENYISFRKDPPERILFIDFDGVIFPYHDIFKDLVLREFPEIFDYVDEDFSSLDPDLFEEQLPIYIPDSLWCRIRRRYRESNLKFKRELIDPDTPEVLKSIKDLGFSICILTARSFPEGENQGRCKMLKWLEDMGIPFDELFFLKDKKKLWGSIGFDKVIVIDDQMKHLREMQNLDMERFLPILFSPYRDKKLKNIKVARNFRALEEIIDNWVLYCGQS